MTRPPNPATCALLRPSSDRLERRTFLDTAVRPRKRRSVEAKRVSIDVWTTVEHCRSARVRLAHRNRRVLVIPIGTKPGDGPSLGQDLAVDPNDPREPCHLLPCS